MKKHFLNLLLLVVLISCTDKSKPNVSKKVNKPKNQLQIEVSIDSNYYKNKNCYLSTISIINLSDSAFKGKDWELYFNQPPRKLVDSLYQEEQLHITRVQGDLFKITPTDKFKALPKGSKVSLSYVLADWAIKKADLPCGFFIRRDSLIENIYNVKELPFTSKAQLTRTVGDNMPVSTAASCYTTFESYKGRSLSQYGPVTPTPVSIETSSYSYSINSLSIKGDESLSFEQHYLSEKLALLGQSKEDKETTTISLAIDTELTKKSAYNITCNENAISIKGADAAGVFYGVQSLIAFASATVDKEGHFTGHNIQDAPRFGYRGMHLDVSRNFHSKDAVISMLDIMSHYKLNKFHFHLSDDEGWRLEIPGLPELTDIGSKRGFSTDESSFIQPAYGSGGLVNAKENHGTGFYSRKDFIEILTYARQRHIEVIPEIDMPGHARAAIKSMLTRYNKLSKENKMTEATKYLLHDMGDTSVYSSVQSYNDNVICVCQPSTYTFLSKVVEEIANMYKEANVPLAVIHTGGDEVPNGVWKGSPICQKFVTENPQYEGKHGLTQYFLEQFHLILDKHGIKAAGWEEIAMNMSAKPHLPNPNHLSKDFRPFVWNNVWGWGNEDMVYQLANAGYKVVMSSATNLYFDLAYNKDPQEPGYYWAGFCSEKQPFEFTPFNLASCAKLDRMGNPVDKESFSSKTTLTEEGKQNIWGIQGHVWSETVKGRKLLEYYLYPKMLGLAERAWSTAPQWEEQYIEHDFNSDWINFVNRIGVVELPLLDKLFQAPAYRLPAPGAKVVDNQVYFNTYPGLDVRYTLDGSEPTKSSPIYSETIKFSDQVIKYASFNKLGRQSETYSISK